MSVHTDVHDSRRRDLPSVIADWSVSTPHGADRSGVKGEATPGSDEVWAGPPEQAGLPHVS